MAHFGEEGKAEVIIPKISQELLAEMVGTTRSRVSHFMNVQEAGLLGLQRWRGTRPQFPPQYRPPRLRALTSSAPSAEATSRHRRVYCST